MASAKLDFVELTYLGSMIVEWKGKVCNWFYTDSMGIDFSDAHTTEFFLQQVYNFYDFDTEFCISWMTLIPFCGINLAFIRAKGSFTIYVDRELGIFQMSMQVNKL